MLGPCQGYVCYGHQIIFSAILELFSKVSGLFRASFLIKVYVRHFVFDYNRAMLDLSLICPYPVAWNFQFLIISLMDQSIDILIHGTKLGPFLDLNLSIWSKSYGQSLLESIIAELSLFLFHLIMSRVPLLRPLVLL